MKKLIKGCILVSILGALAAPLCTKLPPPENGDYITYYIDSYKQIISDCMDAIRGLETPIEIPEKSEASQKYFVMSDGRVSFAGKEDLDFER